VNLYTTLLRPLLFRLDAEQAHHLTVEACHWLGAVPGAAALSRAVFEAPETSLRTEVAGLSFANPLGLAAGWDKSGRALRMTECLGFGFSEIGSVSARPSMGNPKPRLFRLPTDRAIIVNYGLPNDGAEVVAQRLAAHRPQHPLGVNIVKTNDGPDAPPASDDEILADYERSVSLLHPHAGYLSLNLSCPNAKGGKDFFAQPGTITRLLERLAPMNITCPVFLKIAPRDHPAEHERVLMECDAFAFIKGFCFNLAPGKPETLEFTTARETFAHQPGAVAGKPVEALINRCIAELYTRMDRQRYSIIGTGGVFTAEDAYRKIRLGASLVQLYTALIYEGPAVVKTITLGLARLLERDGFSNAAAAVGSAHPSSSDS
jgi:dihydroorotate dehydrogenase